MAEEIPSTMQAVVVEDHKCVVVSRPVPSIAGREILIKIHYTAINRADTLQRKGSYNPPPGATDILGLECTGVVVAKGPDCVLRIPEGSRVMSLLSGGGYAEYVKVDERMLIRVPDEVAFPAAAAIPEVWLTAYQLLHFVGQVKAGDTVLIHAAGSGVGTAAIQLAVGAGATVVAVAGTQAKLDHAKELGASFVANYKETSFAPVALEASGGKGVDVILDPVGASFWAQNVESAAVDSRWVVYGLMGGAAPDAPVLRDILRKRIHLEGTTLRSRSDEYKILLSNELGAHAISKFVDGSYKPIIFSTFPLTEAQAAHDQMESNVNMGKILLQVVDEPSEKK